MKYYCFIFPFFFFINSCVQQPDVFIGRTYFSTYHVYADFSNALAAPDRNDRVEWSGVYTFHPFAQKNYPALLTLYDNRVQFLLLADSLDVQYGDFLHLSGVPQDTILPLGFSYTTVVSILNVKNIRLEKDTHVVLSCAQQDYLFFQNEWRDKVRASGSKLIWPDYPQWQLFVDKERSNVIAFFGFADLMYAVDVNFVYDFSSYKLKEIYAHEWFKGE